MSSQSAWNYLEADAYRDQYEYEEERCQHTNVKEGAGGYGECQDCGAEVVL